MQKLKYYFLLLLFVLSNLSAQGPLSASIYELYDSSKATAQTRAAIMNWAQKLSHVGVLKNENGFIYVDVDDAYIHKLVTFLEKEGFEKPPYFGRPGLVGAHITVIYSYETAKYGIEEIEECGKKISFKIKECQIIQPPSWDAEELCLLVIEAPELNRIRYKYGLPKQKYPFHITIGIKPKMAKCA